MLRPLQFLVDEFAAMFIGPYEMTRLRETRRVFEEFDKQVNLSLLTAQEYLLSGLVELTGRLPQEKYLSSPHTPIDVIDGKMTVEECNRRRQDVGKFPTGMPNYWGKSLGDYASLEPLNLNSQSPKCGQAVRDPKLLEAEHLPENHHHLPRIEHQFPFKRPEQLQSVFS